MKTPTLEETKQALRAALGEADIAKAPGQKEWSRKERKANQGRVRKALKGALQKQYVKGASSKHAKEY
jgi:hypothetical protein